MQSEEGGRGAGRLVFLLLACSPAAITSTASWFISRCLSFSVMRWHWRVLRGPHGRRDCLRASDVDGARSGRTPLCLHSPPLCSSYRVRSDTALFPPPSSLLQNFFENVFFRRSPTTPSSFDVPVMPARLQPSPRPFPSPMTRLQLATSIMSSSLFARRVQMYTAGPSSSMSVGLWCVRRDLCLNHLLSQNPPYGDEPMDLEKQMEVLRQIVFNGLRPEIPESTPPLLADLMQLCWAMV